MSKDSHFLEMHSSKIKTAALIVFSLLTLLFSTDGFFSFINWHKAGSFGDVTQRLLQSLTFAVLTAVALRLTMAKPISELTIETLFGRLNRRDFDKCAKIALERYYQFHEFSADTIWELLSKKVLGANEHWENVDTVIDINGDVDSKGYAKLIITREYTIRSSNNRTDLRFCCKFAGNHADIIHDNNFDISWIFLPSLGETTLPQEAFVLKEVRIEDDPIAFATTKHSDARQHIEYSAPTGRQTLDGVKVKFVFEVMQSMDYGFVSIHFSRLSKDPAVTLNYSKAKSISHVHTIVHMLAEKKIRISESDNSLKWIKVKADGWVLPGGGAAFSWERQPERKSSSV
jgi:hypothetical protein